MNLVGNTDLPHYPMCLRAARAGDVLAAVEPRGDLRVAVFVCGERVCFEHGLGDVRRRPRVGPELGEVFQAAATWRSRPGAERVASASGKYL